MFFQFETLFPQVRVYFRLEGLHVEIFSARDVIPLDPNGDCQVSSPYLIFVFFYTTAIWDQEILYLKVHKFATKVFSQQNCASVCRAVFSRSYWTILQLAKLFYTTSSCDGYDKYEL